MTPPSLPYKQLAASIALAGAMLLAAQAGDDAGGAGGPRMLVGVARTAAAATGPVPRPRDAHRSGRPGARS